MTEKRKSKMWYKIIAPKILNEINVGEILGPSESEGLIGRKISLPLSEISKELLKYYIKMTLRIKEIKGEQAYTDIVAYELTKPYLSRIIKRKGSRVDLIRDIKLKDNKPVRIKGLLMTAFRTTNKQRKAVYHAFEEELEKFVIDKDFEALISLFISGKPQKEMISHIKKVYPVKFLDIRSIEILSPKKESKAINVKEIEEKYKKQASSPKNQEIEEEDEEPKKKKETSSDDYGNEEIGEENSTN